MHKSDVKEVKEVNRKNAINFHLKSINNGEYQNLRKF